ncbi:MAG: M20 family metallo-hydrolase [Gaiellales bacterium]
MSEEEGHLTRRYATPALVAAGRLLAEWMKAAGLTVTVDPAGNVRGRTAADGAPLVLGSHYDTVCDAGRYDGPLGVLLAIEVAERSTGPLEVIAFADEEGVRFSVAYLGSSAYRGRFSREWLSLVDRDGITLAEALADAGGDGEAVARLESEEIAGYLEAHIEQGPVLEDESLPVGVVSAICGQTRARAVLGGAAGHAGTVPADLRTDALSGAAELVLTVERVMRETDGLVATVGELVVEPGAANVIPGRVALSVDVRHATDSVREKALSGIETSARELAAGRGLELEWSVVQSTPAVAMDTELSACLADAIAAQGMEVRRLVSGAGHDAVVVGQDAPAAMLFVRCRGGISHSPLESVEAGDVVVALRVLEDAVRRWGASRAPGGGGSPRS